MAFPKRGTRRVVVGDDAYLWYRKPNQDIGNPITVRRADSPQGQFLCLDTTAYNFDFGPAPVCAAIAFALTNGWTPTKEGPTLFVWCDEVKFYFLPPGERPPRWPQRSCQDIPLAPWHEAPTPQ